MIKAKHFVVGLLALSLGISAPTFAVDSTSMAPLSTTPGSGITPYPGGSYVLASGVYNMPYIPGTLGFSLYIVPPGFQSCAPGTTPYINVALNSFRSYENWTIGQIYVQTFTYQNYGNEWSFNAIPTRLGWFYAIGVLLAAQNSNNNWWSGVGISWTLYCLQQPGSYWTGS